MDLPFVIKKTISLYLHPLTIGLEAIVIGIVLIGLSRRAFRKPPGRFRAWLRRASGDLGMGLAIFGVFFLFMCSIKPVAAPLVFSLEKKFPPLPLDQMAESQLREVAPDFIVVLGGGERYDPGKPPTSLLSYAAMARVGEAARLAGLFPKATVVFTGTPQETRAMTETILAMGVTAGRVVSESASKETTDHPILIRPIVGDGSLFLVTSGTHMPRSMMLFEAAGYRPTPAPCDLWVWPAFGDETPYLPQNFIPAVEHLWMTHLAFHEYLGMFWLEMRGVEAVMAEKEKAHEPKPSLPEPSATDHPVLPLPDRTRLPVDPEPAPELPTDPGAAPSPFPTRAREGVLL